MAIMVTYFYDEYDVLEQVTRFESTRDPRRLIIPYASTYAIEIADCDKRIWKGKTFVQNIRNVEKFAVCPSNEEGNPHKLVLSELHFADRPIEQQ